MAEGHDWLAREPLAAENMPGFIPTHIQSRQEYSGAAKTASSIHLKNKLHHFEPAPNQGQLILCEERAVLPEPF
ncbi:MAG: hypothetical protein F8N36_07160 [Desulfovibrio sp.]|uniref:hypothetical protein n=1 Tax=Desulfovibrio sp. TaxID=885 RepID=UPI00135F0327|nr:hypothetical protein [Desulfovibrio sp.]MTJ92629.1 hypothetical protein [Desulfovibrio sp.]